MLDLLMEILHSPVHPASSAAEEDLIGPTTHQKLKGNDNGREREEKCDRLGICIVRKREEKCERLGL